jgi:hypothetical protein
MDTELAIRKLDPKLQGPFRILTTRKLNRIKASNNQNNIETKRQSYILKNINSKLIKEDAMIVKADKGKTCVIIRTSDYTNKIQSFLDNNNFQKLPRDPTDKYQKSINQSLQHCILIVNKKQAKHLIQKKPQAPSLKAQIKNTQTR